MSFIGASGTVFGFNLTIYCVDNPVMRDDSSGFLSAYSLKRQSFLFKLAEKFGIALSSTPKNMVTKRWVVFNIWLVKLEFSVSYGLVKNYKAGVTFNYVRNGSVGVSFNTNLGYGYSIAYSISIGWTTLSRSISLVYCSSNDGVFVSLNIDFSINHLVIAAAIAACYYAPQFIPVLWNLVSNSSIAAVTAVGIVTPIVRYAYGC